MVSEHRVHIISALLNVSAEFLSRQEAMFLMPIKSANQMPLTKGDWLYSVSVKIFFISHEPHFS